MESYSIIVLLLAAITLLSTLLLVRRHNRQQQEALQAQKTAAGDLRQIELMRVQNPTDKDLKAYDLIEAERQKVWTSLSTDTSVITAIGNDFSQDIEFTYD